MFKRLRRKIVKALGGFMWCDLDQATSLIVFEALAKRKLDADMARTLASGFRTNYFRNTKL